MNDMSKEEAVEIVLLGAPTQPCSRCRGEGAWKQVLNGDRSHFEVSGCAWCMGMGTVHDRATRQAHVLLGVPLPTILFPTTDLWTREREMIIEKMPYLRELGRAACNPGRPFERGATPRLVIAYSSNGITAITIEFANYALRRAPPNRVEP
jgi:hypothetical protein